MLLIVSKRINPRKSPVVKRQRATGDSPLKEKTMYKPRIVTIEGERVDTRIGAFGYYPGDLVKYDGRKLMVVGIKKEYIDEYAGITVYEKSRNFRLWHVFPANVARFKLIKRHATPKLIKQMKQV
jgi:hypothetical protein